MTDLFRNIRFYILVGSLILSIGIYQSVTIFYIGGQVQTIRLQELYGLVGIVLLYVSLLIGPLCYSLPSLPFKSMYIKARRALGVSVFYFAFLHFVIAFFGQLGGFGGLEFLSSPFLFAIGIAFVALCILFLLTLTSVDYIIEKLSFKNWKLLHRLVYLAGILILIHVVLLGAHFSDLSNMVSQIIFGAIGLLLLLEAKRTEVFFKKYFSLPSYSIQVLVICALVLYYTFTNFLTFSTNGHILVGIHTAHLLQLQNQ